MYTRKPMIFRAPDGEGGGTQPDAAQGQQQQDPIDKQPEPLMDFDAYLRAGGQAEFDRRVTKALQTAREKFADPKVGELEARLDGYIRRDAALRADVDPAFLDFVVFDVGQKAKAGESFEDALAQYLKDHAQYTRQKPQPTGGGWSQHMQGGGDKGAADTDGVIEAFKKLNPTLKTD